MTSLSDATAALRMEYKADAPPFAAFTGDAGKAWLVKGDDGPVGFIEGTDGKRKTYDDLDAWKVDAEAAGITAPADAPAAGAAAAPDGPDDLVVEAGDAGETRPDLPSLVTRPVEEVEPVEGVEPAEPVEGGDDPVEAPEGADVGLFDEQAGEPAPLDEAKGKPNPFAGGGGKPNIGVGSWVSWGGKVGRVDLIVTDGTVPGVEGDHEGTKAKPVARVVEWAKSGLTKTKHAVPVSKLATTFPRSSKKSAQEENLTTLIEQGLPLGVEAKAVQTAYDRGMQSWPGFEHTPVKPAGWAAGRAAALVKAAQDPNAPCNDRDLLRPAGDQ